MEDYQKRGYLREPFRVFHLRDVGLEEMAYHYHEFHKIVILLGGEGRLPHRRAVLFSAALGRASGGPAPDPQAGDRPRRAL